MTGPLQGIKVVECGTWALVPFTASILGDLGADVIKVEEPSRGDHFRGTMTVSPARTATTDAVARPASFEAVNRSKRTITLNLNKSEGREVLYKMVKDSDVFVHNLRPGVAEKIRLDYETLAKHNPKIIYAQGVGFGLKGPDGQMPALEYSALARAGWGYFAGEVGQPPAMFCVGLGDSVGSWVLTMSILAALVARERLNVSQSVEVSLFGSLIATAGLIFQHRLVYGEEYPRRSRSVAKNPLWNMYQCADDRWIVLGLAQYDRFWADFWQAVDAPEILNDPRFNGMEMIYKNSEELVRILDGVFKQKPAKEWLSKLKSKGLICEMVQTASEVIDDPQAIANEYFVEYDDERYGRIKLVGLPYKFSKTKPSIKATAPEFNMHTEEVLLEYGYTWEEILSLRDQGIIA